MGVNCWSEALRQELLPDIRVTLIEPGVVDTELPTHITHAATRAGVQQAYDVAQVKPEEVADVIAFVLARPRHLAINEVLLRAAGQTLGHRRHGLRQPARHAAYGTSSHPGNT